MTKPTVYLETSVISYYAARPSRDRVTAMRQDITREWWEAAANAYELYVSAVVFEEASQGDLAVAARRLALIRDLPVLDAIPEATRLGQALMSARLFPEDADNDAAHVALAAAHGMDYLVTWNFRHLANVHTKARIESRIAAAGLACPIICTPEELGEPG